MKIMLKKIVGGSLILTPSKKIEKKYLRGESDTHAKKIGWAFCSRGHEKIRKHYKILKTLKKMKK